MTYPFVCHDPYQIKESTRRDWGDARNYLLIDPGQTYFCARFEQRTTIYPGNGIQAVNGVYVTTQRFVLINFSSKHERWDHHNTLYGRVTHILDNHFDLIQDVHVIAIEKQVKQNYKMTRLGQHILSYFIVHSSRLRNYPLILELDNQCKTKEFDYAPPKKLTKNQRNAHVKKWAEKKGHDLLFARNDLATIQEIRQSAKQNDPMDTVVMGEAVEKILRKYVPKIKTLVQKKKKKKATRK